MKISSFAIKNDRSPEVIAAVNEAIENGLLAIGEKAEGYSKDECPVATGRLRNSITYATKDFHSSGNDRDGENASSKDKKTHGTPTEKTVHIGTNVDYAPFVEYKDMSHEVGNAHFLRNSVTNHSDEYKETMRAALATVDE